MLKIFQTSRMNCIYEVTVDPNLIFNVITKLIMITKQLKNARQIPLLVVIRRLSNQILERLDTESTSKLLALFVSIKTVNSRVTLGNVLQALVSKLTPSHNTS